MIERVPSVVEQSQHTIGMTASEANQRLPNQSPRDELYHRGICTNLSDPLYHP